MCAPLAWRLETGYRCYRSLPSYRQVELHLGVEFTLDRRRCETEERLMWADALFFKDPLDPRNFGRSFSDRDIQVLILIACLTRFYDFALELIRNCYQEGSNRFALENLVDILAANHKNQSLKEFNQFYNNYDPHDKEAYLLYRKFIDKHRFNSTVDYVL